MSDILDLGIRRKIFDLILKNPGLHVSKIAEFFKLSTQLTNYHLLYMERHDVITIEHEKGYTRCYVKGLIGTEDKQLLSLLRQEIPLSIIVFLLKFPYSRHSDIYKELEISSPLFSYHLRKLVKKGIIKTSTSGNKKGYIITNPKEIAVLLIRYKPASIAKMVKDTWADFGPG